MDLTRSQTRLKKGATNRSGTHNTQSSANLDGLRSKTGLNSSQVFASGSRQSIRSSHVGLDKKGLAGVPAQAVTIIRDEDGNDVTPVSLMAVKPVRGHHKDAGASATDMSMTSVLKETVSDVLNHLEQLSTSSWSSSAMGKSGASFVASSHAASGSESTQQDDDDSSSVMSSDSVDDVRARTGSGRATKQSANALPGLSMQPKIQAEIDPNKMIHVQLTETNTIVLLDVPSVCVSNESVDDATLVKAANAKYKELKAIRANNDNYVERGMQTFDNAHKSKDVQATAQKQANAEVMVNQWAIFDAYNEGSSRVGTADPEAAKDVEMEGLGIEFTAGPGSLTGHVGLVEASVSDLGSRSIARSNSVFAQTGEESSNDIAASNTNTHAQVEAAQTAQARAEMEHSAVLSVNSDKLVQSLQLMERAVVGNNYEKKLISYRNVADAEKMETKRIQEIMRAIERDNEENNMDGYEREGKEGQNMSEMDHLNNNIPTLQLLWSYRCELTRGRSVLYMAWNKQNEDILAVAYGEPRPPSGASPGLILCWSVKNPEWPERIYTSASPVTAIDFSRMNPGLLAAGFIDGRVAIYDVRRTDDRPALDDSDMNGKHHDPVWELKWVERERVMGDEHSRGETLVSVSTDGRVTQWIVRKGLEFADLMTLKRLTKQKAAPAATSASGSGGANTGSGSGAGNSGGGGKSTSFIARQTGGLCFDFNPKDSNIYLVGTEDGHIHKCSCSYNEQYLSTFYAHNGPVNKVKWSPFLQGAFLSCSSDWTVRLWNQDSEEEVFKFQSGRDSITDIAWSPHASTCFGSVSSDGRLEIWDLQFSVLDPIINHNVLDRQLTSIMFASQSPTILTGDDYGAVTVYKICRNMANDEDASTAGIMDTRAGMSAYDEQVQAWKGQQAHALTTVIMEKNNAGWAAASAAAAAAATGAGGSAAT
ncbi:WD40-repeat-containing domain protein [Entophlyctis helioformis]|nr:WD40-repeat-containing domain protein [Entophlyctis helioformis]